MEKYYKEIDELIILIKNSIEFKEYKKLKEKINKDLDIKEKTKNIKKLQQEIVNKEYKKEDTKKLEKQSKKMYNELYQIPLYNDYQNSIKELDNILLIIKNKFDEFIKKIIL